jgi:uncharacterized membrane protein YsdA (DUF1294 family)
MILSLYVFAINAITFLLFGLDKCAAIHGNSRIPEKTLLLASALGGSVGAILAQQRFRHKTQKQLFKSILFIIVASQVALIILYVTGILQIR